MKRLGLMVGVLLAGGLIPGNGLFASSMCTGTLAELIGQVCNFDVFSIQVVGFSGSAPGGTVLTTEQINLTAMATLGDTSVSVLISAPPNLPFQAGGAAPGTSVSANYNIQYVLIGPSVFESENLTVNGGSVSLPATYSVNKTANGALVHVGTFTSQSNTTLLPGTDTVLNVSDTITLSAATTVGRRDRPPIVGSSRINSIQNTFLALPPPPVPEPIAFVLCGSGLLVFGLVSRRRRRQ